MTLPPLATTSDLTARGVTVEQGETTLVDTYLATASAAIRDAAGCPITSTTSTVDVEGARGQWQRLPAPPVTAVAMVDIDGNEVTDWRLVAHQLWRPAGWSPEYGPSVVTVTYTHGMPQVPADIVTLACRMAVHALVAHRSASDGTGIASGSITSESIGDWSVSYDSSGRVTDMELTAEWRTRLAARFGSGAGMVGMR